MILSACGGAASVSTSGSAAPAPASSAAAPAPSSSAPAASSVPASSAAPASTSASASASASSSPSPSASGSAAAAAKPSANTFVWGRSGDAVKLDPAIIDDGESSQVTHVIFDGLVQFKPGTTDIAPALATKWQASSDGLTWTFTLRQGVKFQDGTDFNADAVKFNFDRWSDAKNQYRPNKENEGVGFEYFHDFLIVDDKNPLFKSAEVVDPSTVKLTINYSYAPFLHDLAMFPFAISSPTAIKKDPNNYGEHPVGTGPFKFVEWVHDDHITVAANPDYWGGGPKGIQTLVFKVIKDNAARFLQLKAGALSGMEFPNTDDVTTAKSDSNLQVTLGKALNVGYLATNDAEAPFNNVQVRQAMAYAINKQDIVDAFYKGTGQVAKELLAPGMLGYDDSIQDYAYDPNKAKALLSQAGATNISSDFWYMPVSRPYFPNPKDIATAMASDLGKVGIKTNLVTEDWKLYLQDRTTSKFKLWLLGWTGDNGDPDNFYCEWFCSYNAQQADHSWNNPDTIALLKKAATIPDDTQRATLYKQAAQTIHDQEPRIPIAHNQPPYLLLKTVSGFIPNPVGDYDFTNVSIK